jgi:hypothetical protein
MVSVFFTAIVYALIALSDSAIAEVIGKAQPLTKEGKEAARLMKEWVDAARSVAIKSNDAEALRTFTFLEKRLVPARPLLQTSSVKKGFITLNIEAAVSNGRIPEPHIYFLPLKKEHARIEYFRPTFSKHAGAHYYSTMPGIGIKTFDAYSSMVKGATLLHEGCHAVRNSGSGLSEYEQVAEEVSCKKIDNRLQRALWGPKYDEALAREKKRLRKGSFNLLFVNGKVSGTIRMPGRLGNESLIRLFNSQKISGQDQDFYSSLLWLSAAFDVMAEKYPQNVFPAQVIFLMLDMRKNR